MATKPRIEGKVDTQPEINLQSEEEQEVKTEAESEDDLVKLLEQISKQDLIEIIRSISSENKKFTEEIHKRAAQVVEQPVKLIGNRLITCDLASSSGQQWIVKRKNSSREEILRRKIFVGNVIPNHPEITSVKLHSFFSQYGEIEEGPLGFDKETGEPKGFAVFMYKTMDGVRKALEEPIKNFYGHPLYCESVSCSSNSSSNKLNYGHNSPTRSSPLKNDECNPVGCSSPCAGAGAGATVSACVGVTGASACAQRKIFVGNVSANSEITAEKLRKFFSKFGEIEHGPFGFNEKTGKPKGYAFFIYRTAEGARKALEKPTKDLNGHKLYCEMASGRSGSNKQKYGSGLTENLHRKNERCDSAATTPTTRQPRAGASEMKKSVCDENSQSHQPDTSRQIGLSGDGPAKKPALAKTGICVCVACVSYYLKLLLMFILCLVGVLFLISRIFFQPLYYERVNGGSTTRNLQMKNDECRWSGLQ